MHIDNYNCAFPLNPLQPIESCILGNAIAKGVKIAEV